MKKRWIVLIIAIVAVAAAACYVYIQLKPGQAGLPAVYVNVTKENFAQVLASNSFVKDLPNDAVISLKVDEDYYAIRKSGVIKEEADLPDFKITIPGKYIPMLWDLCAAMDSARNSGELGFESGLSKISLLWKYKSMLKYRECFGF